MSALTGMPIRKLQIARRGSSALADLCSPFTAAACCLIPVGVVIYVFIGGSEMIYCRMSSFGADALSSLSQCARVCMPITCTR